MLMIGELNAFLIRQIGNNGSKHVHLDDFSESRGVFIVGYDGTEPVCCAGIRQMDASTGEVKRVYARPNQNGNGAQLMACL